VFVTKTAKIYSLGHTLTAITAVPILTQTATSVGRKVNIGS